MLQRTAFGTALVVSITAALAITVATAGADPVALGGTPMTVYVDSLGQCQSWYANTSGNLYAGDSQTGDCGLFIATPSQPGDQPSELQGQVFGFNGRAGPVGVNEYEAIAQGSVTGDGSGTSPYQLVTVYDVLGPDSGDALLQITQTTRYVTGKGRTLPRV